MSVQPLFNIGEDMSGTTYKSEYFGEIEKYTWVQWDDYDALCCAEHEDVKIHCTGVLLGQRSDGYFKFLALYKDGETLNCPEEYKYCDLHLRGVNMSRVNI